MKRSSAVAVLLLGGATPLLISCGDDGPHEATVYPSIEACARELPVEDCRNALAAAQEEHRASAPQFSNRDACETEVGDGACTWQTRDVGGLNGTFVPTLVGFMVGRGLTGSYAQPVYFDRQGYARSGTTQIGRPVAPEPRSKEEEEEQSGSGSGGGHGGGRYYTRGDLGSAQSAKPITITGHSAGFGATGSVRGFSGS
ncbi:DUF1190 domain-containing protein [Azospirillum soli]|uniref:DUF1190 domain-containing protein n=1 Tax=Azospirillum soli TaxID=1304799 RepID=UPI001AE6940C|nr:DUF1190 domain-containing protein [Azospirillum soli]MBP2313329.1 uncharacterized protein YgiB involved in biofilm formation [Azospirillum soli]